MYMHLYIDMCIYVGIYIYMYKYPLKNLQPAQGTAINPAGTHSSFHRSRQSTACLQRHLAQGSP